MPDFTPPGPIPDPTPPTSSPTPDATASAKRSWRTWAAAAAVAVLIAGGGGYAISRSDGGDGGTAVAAGEAGDATGSAPGAASGPGGGDGTPRGMGTAGTIAALDGDSFTIEVAATDQAEATTLTVRTSDDTTFTETADGDLTDLAVGDTIRATGETTDAGVTASTVVDSGDDELAGPGAGMGGPPPDGVPTGELPAPPDGADGAPTGTPPEGMGGGRGGPGAMGAAGTITAIDGDVLTVESADGTEVAVTLTEETTISVTTVVTLDDLAAGDTVLVIGATADGTVDATAVRAGELPSGGFGGGGPVPPAGAPPAGGAPGDDATTTTGA